MSLKIQGISVWRLIDEMENFQMRADRFELGLAHMKKRKYNSLLSSLKTKSESLLKGSMDNRFILLYKGLKGGGKISNDVLIPEKKG